MSHTFASVEAALMVLSNPADPAWGDAFAFLSSHPETASLMVETFRDTLQSMGVEPSGVDPDSGEPAYSLSDVARAMGVAESDLERSMGQEPPREP